MLDKKMSTTKNLRKRTSQINYKQSDVTPRKKIKTEDVEITTLIEQTQSKHPIVAPDGKTFYPCQYCSKIFPQKTTSVTHMKKCPNKKSHLSIRNKDESQETKTTINSTNKHGEQTNDLHNSGSSTENKKPTESTQQPKIKISQNITVKAAPYQKQPVNDASVYDYNEEETDKSGEENNSKEEDEDILNNRKCKHCKTLFENPLDLLRHTRDCHNFPRTILPPDEIEKYFDSPNRNFCPICEKPIKTRNFRSVFIKHLLVHTTGLTHECNICKKKFRRRDHMRAHEKRHIVSV